ncbi:hypothetical protein BOW53_03890 [Solemya pervernicosa gill symbiont]|uniref:YqhA family protein n=2 Tax=Gammaproteobacteria incertae sedis TaxID=118884 RepID=A0A1T2L8F2_9GAMM|nr:YqhA family protein [Candidatus Reidiella endopervernicosa]OOZ41398.1 hypothetical protein BOW53_03890 [Solemya pervernicosa gill symbiont]QKQ27563.1 YqhA family protein [Candidatus Reidiella endopervernicosa]
MLKRLEKWFEGALWNSRLVVLSAVITSLLTAFAVFYMATIDAVVMISHLGDYASFSLSIEARNELRSTTVTHVVEIIDGYLLATVLLIFALGLYELFISKIDQAEGSENSSNILLIHSLDDLKARLAKVILMILVVKFFEHAIGMPFKTPIDLLYLAGGIALIGLALYLSHAGDKHSRAAEK